MATGLLRHFRCLSGNPASHVRFGPIRAAQYGVMRPTYTVALAALSLIQPGCGAPAQRAVAQAAVFTAIEVAGAAMQAAADRAAERDAKQRARLHATPTGSWSLVRASDEDTDGECEQASGVAQPDSDCDDPDDSTSSDRDADSTPNAAAEGVTVGGCIVCE